MNMQPTVEIDDRSGFCHGVVAAIAKAEDELSANAGEPLYCLGDIVHNSDEVERLENRGLLTINHDDLRNLHNVKVLLRAHGEPPSTYDLARLNGIRIVDATCPVVLRLQQRIKATYDSEPQTQIVIYGKKGHAEVNGLVGQTEGRAIVIESPDRLDAIDFNRDIALYSQTTMPLEGFRRIIDEISCRISEGVNFSYYDTICRQVANRVDHIRHFAATHDVVLFVAGAKSSNGKVLLEQCREVNPRTHHIARRDDFDPDWIADAATIGICGATSTPRWLMEEVKNEVTAAING